jgi:hypothetical protein
MSEWLPIETAPRDGTGVLLFFPSRYGDHIVISGFWGGTDEPDPEPGWYHRECDSNKLTGWGDEPTHWMLMPEPPNGLRPVRP